MPYARAVSYWIIFVVLTFIFSLIDPQLLVIPLGLLLYLMRAPLRAALKYLPLSFAYVLLGTLSGLLVEIFAILNYFHDPKNSHLFSLNPAVDLTIAFGFYCTTTIAIYLIVRKIEFGNIGFLICSAIYAIVIEQQGAILLMGIANPILAPTFWLYVSIVYAVFTWGLTQCSRNGSPPAVRHTGGPTCFCLQQCGQRRSLGRSSAQDCRKSSPLW